MVMSVYLDNRCIYSDVLDDYELHNAVVQLEYGLPGKFTFRTVKPLNVRPMLSIVEVDRGSEALFRGRIIECTQKLYWTEYTAEGTLGVLHDTYYKITKEVNDADELVRGMLEHHSQYSANHILALGGELKGMVKLEQGYMKCYDILQKVAESLGGFFYADRRVVRFGTGALRTNNQPIELGENILDERIKGNYSDMKTVVVCTSGTKEVARVNQDMVSKHGYIYEYIKAETSNPEAEAEARLAQVSTAFKTLELSAVDLSSINSDFDAYRLYDNVRIKDGRHGIDLYMMVKSLSINLQDVASNSISFGRQVEMLTKGTSLVSKEEREREQETNAESKLDKYVTATNGRRYELVVSVENGKPKFEFKEVNT